jgi:hypothetical protein|nr:MAG TPA: Carboxypeptidase regulatory-like domain protein [Caudoviricetes sp.]
MRKIGFFNIGKLGLVKSAGTGKTDINKVIEKWIPKHMVFWYDMSKPVDTYSQNFNDWSSHPSVNADIIITSTSFVITRFATLNDTVKCYIPDQTKNFPGMKVEVKGIVDGQELYWGYSANVKLVNITQDGTYDIPPLGTVNGNLSFRNGNIVGACNITITQLPSGQSVPTNEILKANPYLQDHSGNNRPLKLNNFLFAAMSGVGGYDIASTNILPDRANVTVTDNRIIHITKKLSTTDNMVNIVPANSNPTHKFKVTGLSDGRQVSLVNRNGGFYTFDNGEHEVTLTYPEGTTSLYNAIGVTGDIGDMDVTIEFLPKYPNALITDGVDDYGVVENLQQGVKVLFMTATPLALYKTWYAQNSFSIYGQPNTIAYNYRNADGVTYLDGTLNETIQTNNLLNKKKTVTIVNPTDGSNNNVIFFNSYGSSYMNLAFYNSFGFDSVPTKQDDGFTEQDLIDYYRPKAIVTITVVDVSGSPIQDATVTVGGVQYKTLSDGTVKVRGMANGTMSLSVKKDGYMPFSDNSWNLADSRITLEVLRNTIITENGYNVLLENNGLILTE